MQISVPKEWISLESDINERFVGNPNGPSIEYRFFWKTLTNKNCYEIVESQINLKYAQNEIPSFSTWYLFHLHGKSLSIAGVRIFSVPVLYTMT